MKLFASQQGLSYVRAGLYSGSAIPALQPGVGTRCVLGALPMHCLSNSRSYLEQRIASVCLLFIFPLVWLFPSTTFIWIHIGNANCANSIGELRPVLVKPCEFLLSTQGQRAGVSCSQQTHIPGLPLDLSHPRQQTLCYQCTQKSQVDCSPPFQIGCSLSVLIHTYMWHFSCVCDLGMLVIAVEYWCQ